MIDFSKSTWNRFYVTHLHNPSMLTTDRYKPTIVLVDVCLGLRDAKAALRNPSGWLGSCNPHWSCRPYTFYMYSPTEGVGKFKRSIGYIARILRYLDDFICKKYKLLVSYSKCNNKMTWRLNKAIFRMRRKVIRLQSEFDIIIIPPFKVSSIVNRKTRRITRKTVRKMLCWTHYRFR
ncbi:hypothetical protein G9A89_022644 [Geosiphon pyriformis]|nr:hypothetical protein G9A89_022644 [Geosiphon pyriformis]